MYFGMERKYTRKEGEGSFRLNVNLERFRLELQGGNAQKCLQEINKMLDKLNNFASDSLLDELGALDYKLENMLSDELVFDRKVAKILSNYSQIYKDYKVSKVSIENKRIVELDQGKVNSEVEFEDIKKGVANLLFKIQRDKVKNVVVHIKGDTSDDDKNKIIDHIMENLPQAEVKKFFTKNDLTSHTIVEAVFFGEFNFEIDDEQ